MGLFTPKWLGKDENKALDAVAAAAAKDDQRTLIRIVNEAVFLSVKIEAIKNVKDQMFLANLVLTESETGTWMSALKGISDQAVLKQLYPAVKEPHKRADVAGRITDVPFLKQIVETDPAATVQKSAVSNIHDEAYLKALFSQDKNSSVREQALSNLTDQDILEEIVLTELSKRSDLRKYDNRYDTHVELALRALEKTENNQALYAKILRILQDPGSCQDAERCLDLALERLTDEELLLAACRDETVLARFRLKAAKKIEDRLTQEDFMSLAMLCRDTLDGSNAGMSYCYKALEKVTDQEKLLYVANHTTSMRIRIRAINRLEDTSGLEFWTDREHCDNHDMISYTNLRYLSVINGKWQCPYCGEALENCSYGHNFTEKIKEKDMPPAD